MFIIVENQELDNDFPTSFLIYYFLDNSILDLLIGHQYL